VQVFVGEQVASRNSILWAVLRSSLGPMLLALPLLALAAWWAVRQGVAPLRLVGRALAQRSPDALQPIAVKGAPTEMTPMLDALNGLFGRIAELLESERRFTADAAHELRTPIAAIRAQAQVALGAAADAERLHALQATLQGCDRAARLVEQLLTLSKLESGAAHALVAVDLAALARQVVADAAPQALGKQQAIEVDATGPCTVRGDATLLAVMIRNLVDNAIRYSPSGATVKLAVSNAQGVVRLCLDDSGPGMSPPDMERVGERFFRVVGSGQDGSGLGWSIMRRIAAVHGAIARVARSASLGGLSVEVRFPAEETD
jgi:two-component system sensor histidine kinase QseC